VDADHGVLFSGVVERLFHPPCDAEAKPLETPFRLRLRRMLDLALRNISSNLPQSCL
jgi:hypothetical protein